MTRRARGQHPKRYKNRASGSLYFSGWRQDEKRKLREEQISARVVLSREYLPDGTTVEIVDLVEVEPRRAWHHDKSTIKPEQVACATPASRIDHDLLRENLYTWRGMSNPSALRLALLIKDEIPPDSFFVDVDMSTHQRTYKKKRRADAH